MTASMSSREVWFLGKVHSIYSKSFLIKQSIDMHVKEAQPLYMTVVFEDRLNLLENLLSFMLL